MTALLLTALLAGPIDESALLLQMASYTHLFSVPNPTYLMKQESSYDRASVEPGSDAWFANADAGKYIRIEEREGRTERVIMDSTQPGAVMRIWSANPVGTLRFYFDGETNARWTVAAQDLLGGKFSGIADPFAYVSSRGWNLYYPIPYAKGLKITAEGEGTQHMYYHVGFRAYRQGASLKTFDPNRLARPISNEVARRLKLSPAAKLDRSITLGANEARTLIGVGGAGTLRSFSVQVIVPGGNESTSWSHPQRMHNVLRRLRLVGWMDGELCIDVPLGDFFGSAPGINAYESFPFSVSKEGRMTCRFPMPYNRAIDLSVLNENGFPVRVDYAISAEKVKPGAPRNLFKAHYLADFGPSQPKRDMEMLSASGEGWLVGSMLCIENSRPEWWGEGDEKIYLDGEKFPSFFGTGTEDFYGYAWCWPDVYQRPFHSQPRCDGPGNFGHTSVNRWMIGDAIPFRKSLRFDMELWHWASCDVKFSRITYWYAKPGGSAIRDFVAALALPKELVPNPPIAGAIEGESLRVLERTGGKLENQGGFWELSSGKQLWWTHMESGQTLRLELNVPSPGTYELFGNFCHARDYGVHRIEFADQSKSIDFYNEKLGWNKVSLGAFKTSESKITMTVTSMGKRPEAIAGNMFGLDYLLLEKKPL